MERKEAERLAARVLPAGLRVSHAAATARYRRAVAVYVEEAGGRRAPELLLRFVRRPPLQKPSTTDAADAAEPTRRSEAPTLSAYLAELAGEREAVFDHALPGSFPPVSVRASSADAAGGDVDAGPLPEATAEAIQRALDGVRKGTPPSNGCPNTLPTVATLALPDTDGVVVEVSPAAPFTLHDVIAFSPAALLDDLRCRLLAFQLATGVASAHARGRALCSGLSTRRILVSRSLWVWMTGDDEPKAMSPGGSEAHANSADCTASTASVTALLAAWQAGELSNYDYILALNELAGRRWGDRRYHVVMPWVIDFTVPPEELETSGGSDGKGWRDLSRTKWRLAKGDEQLDFTYANAATPHHVSDDCLSELGVCMYKARRLPQALLTRVVRTNFEAREYPASMQRLYSWTPDEAIPEFYSDAQIFSSCHSGMEDLAVPPWATSPEDFVKRHRAALESPYVSQRLHKWIDLTFGFALFGDAAMAAKNVELSPDNGAALRASGRAQLFSQPHPSRQSLEYRVRRLSEPSCTHEETNDVQHMPAMQPYQGGKALDASSEGDRTLIVVPEGSVEAIGATLESFAREAALFNSADPQESTDVCSLDCAGSWCSGDLATLGRIIAAVYLRDPHAFNMSGDGFLAACERLPYAVQAVVSSLALVPQSERVSADALLRSTFFPTAVHEAASILGRLNTLPDGLPRLVAVAELMESDEFHRVSQAALGLVAPMCLDTIIDAAEMGAYGLNDSTDKLGTELAAASEVVVWSLLKRLGGDALRSILLPALVRLLRTGESGQDGCNSALSMLRSVLLGAAIQRKLRERLGTPTFLRWVQPLLVNGLRTGVQDEVSAVAASALAAQAGELPLPVMLQWYVRPLLANLTAGPRIPLALSSVANSIGEDAAAAHVLPPLLRALAIYPGGDSWDALIARQSFPPTGIQPSPGAVSGALRALHGVLGQLDSSTVVSQVVCLKSSSSSLVQLVVQPYANARVLDLAGQCIARCLSAHGADAAGGLLAHLGPLFAAVSLTPEFPLSTLNEEEASAEPSSPACEPPSASRTTPSRACLDLVHKLYPMMIDTLGLSTVRNTVQDWAVVEYRLDKHFGWKLFRSGDSAAAPQQTRSRRNSEMAKVLNEFNAGWHGLESGTEAAYRRRSISGEFVVADEVVPDSSVAPSSRAAKWAWVPPLDVTACAAHVPLDSEGEEPWPVSLQVLTSWRAHAYRLHTVCASEDEGSVVTAGGGLLRVWSLAMGAQTCEYTGHREGTYAACFVGEQSRLCVSCDTSAAAHVWKADSGETVFVAKEPGHGPVGGAATAPPGGVLEDDRGFTCILANETSTGVVLGTGDGRVRLLDVGTSKLLSSWRCIPSEGTGVTAIKALGSRPSGALYAAASSGHLVALDRRSGCVTSAWRAHEGALTCVECVGEHGVLTGSADKALLLWDVRMQPPAGWFGASRDAPPAVAYRGHKDAVSSVALLGEAAALSTAGGRVGIHSLAGVDGPREITVEPRRLYNARGAKEKATLACVRALSLSRGFVVGTDDGHVRVCR